MNYIIEINDKFLCLEDWVMDDERIEYTKGKVYISENMNCLTDNSGDKYHLMNNCDDFFEHFKMVK